MADELSKWWEEDAARLNEMCKAAHAAGLIKVGGDTPELDKRGREVKTARKSLVELLRRKATGN